MNTIDTPLVNTVDTSLVNPNFKQWLEQQIYEWVSYVDDTSIKIWMVKDVYLQSYPPPIGLEFDNTWDDIIKNYRYNNE